MTLHIDPKKLSNFVVKKNDKNLQRLFKKGCGNLCVKAKILVDSLGKLDQDRFSLV